MKILPLALIITTAMVTMSTSCKKENKCSAGTDGSLTVVAYPQHHGKPILNRANYRDTVYVKFCTQEQMDLNDDKVPTEFDAKFIGETGEDHVHLENIEPGDYYIFVNAFDTTGPYRVFGGIPFSTEQESGEVDLIVPVSEAH